MIEIKNLTVKFPGQKQAVLKNINIKISQKEKILVLGPSGSGKSTLLLSILGIIPRSIEADVTGQVLLLDEPVANMRPNQVCKKLGLLFQEPESQFCMLYPEDEIAFGLENIQLNPKDMKNRIEWALETVGLKGRSKEIRIDQLSGGQQQRLTLASILAQKTELLLLDEPTANLDPKGRSSLVAAVEHELGTGKGILVVEHNLEPWLPLIDRVILFSSKGELLDDGIPEKIFKKWSGYLEQAGIWKPKTVKLVEMLEKQGYGFKNLPLTAEEFNSTNNIPGNIIKKAIDDLKNRNYPIRAKSSINNSTIVELKNVCAGYGKNSIVLKNINLTIHRGEFIALIGPNGSGKSTLAKTLIGMVKEVTGSLRMFEEGIKKIGYVFQNPEHQFVTDTVWDELEYSASQLKLDIQERKNKIKHMLTYFELDKLAAFNPFTLSGGQKRRLSVATMLIEGKELLILDEPTFGQDVSGVKKLMDKIAELNALGTSVLMITHDLDLVDEYAETAVVINQGRIVFTGTTEELWTCEDIIEKCGLELPFRIQVLGHEKGGRLEDALEN